MRNCSVMASTELFARGSSFDWYRRRSAHDFARTTYRVRNNVLRSQRVTHFLHTRGPLVKSVVSFGRRLVRALSAMRKRTMRGNTTPRSVHDGAPGPRQIGGDGHGEQFKAM